MGAGRAARRPPRTRRRPASHRRFRPSWALRSAHAQTLLAGSAANRRLVHWRCRRVRSGSAAWLLDCGEGVSLRGFYNPSPAGRGLAVIIHGWLGSAESSYVLSSAEALNRAGFGVFRLNLRDHGDTEHLNRELFRSTRLREVVEAIQQIQARALYPQCALVGFSLGGNFALRIGLCCAQHNLDIERIVAICPPLNPKHAAARIEAGPYHRHFVRRWQATLRRKLGYFPDLGYSEDGFLGLKTLGEMNRYFIAHHTDYPDLETYYRAYTLTGGGLANLGVDSHVIVSRDDPIIPYGDAKTAARTPALTIEHTRFGGHCGYLCGLSLRSWLPGHVVRLLTPYAPALERAAEPGANASGAEAAVDSPAAP